MTTSSSAQEREGSHDLRDARRLMSLQVHDGTNGSRLPILTFRITVVLSLRGAYVVRKPPSHCIEMLRYVRRCGEHEDTMIIIIG